MTSPIHIVTPNPALDVTYHLPHIEIGEANRVFDITRISGGKGLNAANVLAALNISASVGGFIGGPLIEEFLRGVNHLESRFTRIEGHLRSTVTVVDESGATAFNEAGPHVTLEDWQALTDDTLALLAAHGSRAIVSMNGSNPPGTPDDAYARLVRSARDAGHLVLVDTSGSHLRAAAAAGAHVLKPNHLELAAATGRDSIADGVAHLHDLGAGMVIVSRGRDGLELHARGLRPVHAWLERDVAGNTVGAGDALVAAALAIMAQRLGGIAGSEPLTPEVIGADLLTATDLPALVATSAAAVTERVAGSVSPATIDSLLTHVKLKEL